MATTYWRWGFTGVLAVVTACLMSGCGGGSQTPRVASLGTSTTVAVSGRGDAGSSGATTATTVAKGDPTRLLDEWATCMHTHGDPNQADPTVDAYGVINVSVPLNAQSLSNEIHAASDPCSQYMAAAQAALQAANPVAPPPDQTQLTKYVECMRANGVPNYPYSSGGRTNFNGTGVDPNSPLVQNVTKLCGQKLKFPAWWIAGTGPPGDVVVSSGPNGGPPPGNAGGNGGPSPVHGNGGSAGNSGSGTGG